MWGGTGVYSCLDINELPVYSKQMMVEEEEAAQMAAKQLERAGSAGKK